MKKTAVEWLIEKFMTENTTREGWHEIFEQAKEMEKEQIYKSIDEQVNILKDILNEMMTGFDSEEDRMDFILDICNGYKKRNL